MYESFFGLREKPFSLLPDPSFLFLSKIHQEALTLLEYGLLSQAGFTILTGEIGSGKTTLMRYLLDRLDIDVTVGLISHTHQSLGQLMDWICLAFDLKVDQGSKLDQHEAFVNFLIEQYAKGKRTLLIVDEAQNLGIDKLEELRLLSNINADKDFVLQLMLLGQPQLRDQLRKPELEQFVQRVAASYHLGRLSSEETYKYIRHRIRVAGGETEIFTSDACHGVYHYSKGIPRIINLICDTALVYGYGSGEKIIYGESIDEFVTSHTPHLLISLETEDRPKPEGPKPVFPIPTMKLDKPAPDVIEPDDLKPDAPQPEAVKPDDAEADDIEPEKSDVAAQNAVEEQPVANVSPPPVLPDTAIQTAQTAWPTDIAANQTPPVIQAPGKWPIPLIAMSTAVSISFALILWYGLEKQNSPPDPVDPPVASIKPIQTESLTTTHDSPQAAPDVQNPPLDRSASDTQTTPADTATAETAVVEQTTAPISAAPVAEQPATPAADGVETADTRANTPITQEAVMPANADGNMSNAAEAAPVNESAMSEQTTASHTEPATLNPSDASVMATPAPAPNVLTVTEPPATAEPSAIADNRAPVAEAAETDTTPLPASQPMVDLEQKIKDLSIAAAKTDDNHLKLDLADAVQFEDGSIELNPQSKTILKQLAGLLLEFDHVQAKVIGHTDSMGSSEVNRRLSEKRADVVARFLVSNGVPSERLTYMGMGKTQLKVAPEQERVLGLWVNRRIEIDLTEKN